MNILIDNKNYNLHIIDEKNFNNYKNYLNKISICNSSYISSSYEKLSYTLLELYGYIGFILTDVTNVNVFISCIIDIDCSQIKENVENIDLYDSVEIVLLCSNYELRIPGLTKTFFNIIIQNYIPKYKPDIKYLLLKVAQGTNKNVRAYNFYSTIGFKILNKSIMIYNYNTVGGKKRRKVYTKKQHYKRRKNKTVFNKIKRKYKILT